MNVNCFIIIQHWYYSDLPKGCIFTSLSYYDNDVKIQQILESSVMYREYREYAHHWNKYAGIESVSTYSALSLHKAFLWTYRHWNNISVDVYTKFFSVWSLHNKNKDFKKYIYKSFVINDLCWSVWFPQNYFDSFSQMFFYFFSTL